MVFTLIIMVIILLVLIPVGIVVDKKIEAYFENKRDNVVYGRYQKISPMFLCRNSA